MSEQPTAVLGLIEIAVLDDDLDFRNYIEDFLRDEGSYAVRSFAHPEDLFAASEQQLPDIVLLDMKMGEFTGDKVVEQLLARWPEMCIIVVTGYPSLEDMRATFKLRVFDYLAKPFSLSQLRQTLQNAVIKFSSDNAARPSEGTAGPPDKTIARRAGLVVERSGGGDEAKRVANQLDRTGSESSEH